jgi:NhaP-type Na+/H+ or K+/H+ antiporter
MKKLKLKYDPELGSAILSVILLILAVRNTLKLESRNDIVFIVLIIMETVVGILGLGVFFYQLFGKRKTNNEDKTDDED